LDEQLKGTGAFYVLVDEDGAIVGRFNLYDLADGSANVGYRVAERLAGRGAATGAVQDLCRLAMEAHHLRTLRATTSTENLASQRVLEKTGFLVIGTTHVAGRDGVLYELVLSRT
jgi:[ribosomal protein S5]-alanine N-acetyltransferase